MKKPLNKELNPKLLFSFIAMINGLVTLGVSIYLGIESTIMVARQQSVICFPTKNLVFAKLQFSI